MSWAIAICAALLLGLASAPATAHSVIEGVGGFQGGLLHPLLVPAHALALVAAGFLTSHQHPRNRFRLIAVFVGGMIVAYVLVSMAFSTSHAEIFVLILGGTIGMLLATGWTMPLVSLMLAAILAAAIVFDSVPAVPSVRDTILSLIGTAVAATSIVAATAALSAMLPPGWQRIGIRIVGSWIAASTILVLALRLSA